MNSGPANDEAILSGLFQSRFGSLPETVAPLAAHGSNRRIHRLAAAGCSAVGVVHADVAENAAFVSFSRHFHASGLPVPEILAVAADETAYLETDLGDTTLFELLTAGRSPGSTAVPAEAAAVYEKAVRLLPEFQVRAGRGIDFSKCFPRAGFDRQSMLWDLNYFKYYFLKLAGIPFHEQALENDFDALVACLLQAPSDFFLYRDFQSRNIMVVGGEPWFIDYQGGRRGALQYDLASLLVDAKANLPFAFRERLAGVYLNALAGHLAVDPAAFRRWLDGFALIRILQAMGAYGFRGFYERKPQFLQSVPYAIRNVEALLDAGRVPVALPVLDEALRRIVRSTRLREMAPDATAIVPLTVRVESFSYKSGPPADESGHGGGFVFDCRALPNPGREARFTSVAGDEPPVAAWLEEKDEVAGFVAHVCALVDQAVASFHRRRFTHLSVAFGCTGGQHRSVFCATQLARHLQRSEGVQVDLRHRDVKRAVPVPGPEPAGGAPS